MMPITTEAAASGPLAGARRLACAVLLATLAFGLAACAGRYEMGTTTSLAVEAMAVAAAPRRAAGARRGPLGAHSGRAEERLETGGEDDDE